MAKKKATRKAAKKTGAKKTAAKKTAAKKNWDPRSGSLLDEHEPTRRVRR